MVEMDRMLRPGGRVYIRDSLSLMDQLQQIATAIGWRAGVHDTGEGPHASVRILICDKGIWEKDTKILNGMISLLKANSSSRVLTDNDCDVVLFYFSCIMERVEIHLSTF